MYFLINIIIFKFIPNLKKKKKKKKNINKIIIFSTKNILNLIS